MRADPGSTAARARLRFLWAWLRESGGGIRHRTLRSGIWLVAGDGLTRAALLLKISILGRLLSPADFGLMGIANTLLSGTEFFTQTGISQALIQKNADIRPYLNTVFTIQAFRGFGLAIALGTAAPYASVFFRADVTAVVRSVGLVLLLRGLINPAVIYFRKDLDYRRDTTWRLTGVLGSLVIGLVVAFVYRNVWALVVSVVAAQAIETSASYAMVPFRPRFSWDRGLSRELFGFGKWVFWSNLFICFNLYLDSWVIGRFLGTVNLGFYQVGAQLALVPTALLGTHVAGLGFPALSKLESRSEVTRAYGKMFRLLAIVVLPFSCMLSTFAEPIVRIVLGPTWLGSVIVVQTLGWAGVGLAISGLATAALLACGRPDLPFRASVLRAVVLIALIYPLMKLWGIGGVALSVAFAALFAAGYSVMLVAAELDWPWREFVGSLRTSVASCFAFVLARLAFGVSISFWVVGAILIALAIHVLLILLTLRTEIYATPVSFIPSWMFRGFGIKPSPIPASSPVTEKCHDSTRGC
jgi:O-antigen/teichoic acid export membrane protein